MSIGTILLIVLVLILLGVLPVWPHARSWVTARADSSGALS